MLSSTEHWPFTIKMCLFLSSTCVLYDIKAYWPTQPGLWPYKRTLHNKKAIIYFSCKYTRLLLILPFEIKIIAHPNKHYWFIGKMQWTTLRALDIDYNKHDKAFSSNVKAQSHIPSGTSRKRCWFDENAGWTLYYSFTVCVNLCAHFLHV